MTSESSSIVASARRGLSASRWNRRMRGVGSVLSSELRVAVDRAWDGVWSSGITNPITVSDLLGTVLMVGRQRDKAAWDRLDRAAKSNLGEAVAEILTAARREHGMSAGAEFEATDFWRSTEPIQRALAELEFLRDDSLGTDVLGDIYEHVLSKLSLAGQFGQFRTPKHIVEFMVAIADPRDGELVIDPACGTGGFLVAASAFRRRLDRSGRHEGTEIDRTVARIAASNLAFHDVAEGHISNADGLGPFAERADVILANPPFAGSVSDDVTQRFAIRSKKTELLFLEQMCGLLKPGGRAVVLVPYGAVSGASADGKSIRSMLVRQHSLRAVIELPSGVFRPYTDVKTAILVWEGTPRGTATHMIRVENDGLSLDQRRVPVAFNDLPEALAVLSGGDAEISHRIVPTAEIVAAAMNLNPSRYLAEVPRADREHLDSEDVLAAVAARLSSTLDKVTRLKEETAP